MANNIISHINTSLQAAVKKFNPSAKEIMRYIDLLQDIDREFNVDYNPTPKAFYQANKTEVEYRAVSKTEALYLITKYFESRLEYAIKDERYQLGGFPEETQKWIEVRRSNRRQQPANYHEAPIIRTKEKAAASREMRVALIMHKEVAYEVMVRLVRWQNRIQFSAFWRVLGTNNETPISQLEVSDIGVFTPSTAPDIHKRLCDEWGNVSSVLSSKTYSYSFDTSESPEEIFKRARKEITDYVNLVVKYVSVVAEFAKYEHCLDHAINTWPCAMTKYDRAKS